MFAYKPISVGVLAIALQLIIAPVASAEKSAEFFHKQYEKLFRQFILAKALPPAKPDLRRKHKIFIKRATQYLREIPPEYADYASGVHYFRGRLLLHCDYREKAREDFERFLKLQAELAKEKEGEKGKDEEEAQSAPLPGMPSAELVKAFQACTYLPEKPDKFLTQIKDIPKNVLQVREHVFNKLFMSAVYEFETKAEHLDAAIKVLEVVKEFDLWDPDRDPNPQKLIEIIRSRKRNLEAQ